MRQLSGQAAGHLYADTAQANGNLSLLQIHDQSTAPGGVVRFKQVLAQVESRLHAAPLFRQRLRRVPLALDDPYWVDDARFDLEYHVRHIALPQPGDWRQFCIQVSRIHARPLDLDRPLWEVYVIEGLNRLLELPEGSFALLFKTHLAAVDFSALGRLTRLLYDSAPTPPAPAPAPPWFAETAPGQLALAGQGLLQAARAPTRLVRPLARLATRLAPAAVALAGDLLLRPEHLPPTRFNSVVSPHRVFETRRFREADFHRLRALVRGASLDDAVLTVIGGALRQYLLAEGELPDAQSLSAVMLPTADGAAAAATPAPAHPTWRHLALGTHLEDPAQRLAFVRAQSRAAALAPAADGRAGAVLGSAAGLALKAWSGQWVGRAGMRLGARTATANCSVAMLPPLDQPLYLCGARLTYSSAILPIADGLGLALAVSRYDGGVVISPTACRELVPDPALLAQCLRDSFQAGLACVAAREAAAPAPAPRPRRTAGVKASGPADAGVKPAVRGASTGGKARRSRPPA